MPSYLSLMQWTEQGIKNIKDAPARTEAAKEQIRAAGGRIIFVYMLMGDYDQAILTELPDDATAAKALLALAMQGNARTITYKAFTEDEATAIIEGLP